MTDDATEKTAKEPGWGAMRRFLPYLWPAGEPRLKARIVLALLLVVTSIAVTTLVMPLAYGAAINQKSVPPFDIPSTSGCSYVTR